MVLLPFPVKAELLSIVKQRGWGRKRIDELLSKFEGCILIHSNDEILEAYAEIDAFSQGKHLTKILGMLPRNMGKN